MHMIRSVVTRLDPVRPATSVWWLLLLLWLMVVVVVDVVVRDASGRLSCTGNMKKKTGKCIVQAKEYTSRPSSSIKIRLASWIGNKATDAT